MRPELLVLEGFTAFRQRTVVDFRGADLFALWGPTGAGKSSLIDAMVFALYGSVPRYANKNLVAPVISQQELEARVSLRFTVGDRRYVAARVVRADGKGGASTREARLERLEPAVPPAQELAAQELSAQALPVEEAPVEEAPVEEAWTREVLAGDAEGVSAAVESLLGLSYEHFTTCVVLPQGEFARFLHHTPKDRQALLIRLLDLGVYAAMASLAGERSKVARVRRELEAERLAELDDRTPQRRDELAAQRDQLAALVAQLDAAKPETDRLVRAHEQALSRAAEALAWAERLATVVVPDDVGGLVDGLAVADAALRGAEEAVQAAERAAAAAEQNVAGQAPVAELEVQRARHQRRRELREASVAIATALAAAAGAAEQAGEAEAAARAAAAEAEHALDGAQQELARHDDALAQATPIAELEALLERHDELARLQERLERGRAVLDHDRAALAAAEAELACARAAAAEAEEHWERARAADLAADLASGLRAGDPCPVCGRPLEERDGRGELIEHPGASHGAAALQSARRAFDAASARLGELSAAASEAGRHLSGAEQLFADLRQRSSELETALAARGSRPALVEAAEAARAAASARRVAAGMVDTAQRHWRSVRDVSGPETVARRAGELLARAEQEQRDLAAALAELEGILAEAPDEADTERRLVAARAALDGRRVAVEALADARRGLEGARLARAAAARRAGDLWGRFDELRDTLAALGPPRAAAARGGDEVAAADLAGAWQALAAWAIGAAGEQRDHAAAARAAASGAAEELKAFVDDFRRRAEDRGVEVGERVVRDAVVDRLSRVEVELAHLEADLARAAALRSRVDRLLEEERVAGELARHLQSNRFQKWLLDEAMARLVAAATGVLHQLSNGAYSLLHDRRSGSFSVIDHRNADGVRSVRTLSGGETFLASLALALALADQVAQLAQGDPGVRPGRSGRAGRAGRSARSGRSARLEPPAAPERSTRLESIFLDEGFGTLDPDMLDTVASAIEELATLGRMVGVVTHVRDLAERLPVRFEVARGPLGATVTRTGEG